MKSKNIPLPQLITALEQAWCADTACANEAWSLQNPARGQCVVSSLVVQDYYGGELVRFAVKGDGINEKHYCNLLPGGVLLDTTRSQYTTMVTMQPDPVQLAGYSSIRQKRLADDETKERYELLKQRVQHFLLKNT